MLVQGDLRSEGVLLEPEVAQDRRHVGDDGLISGAFAERREHRPRCAGEWLCIGSGGVRGGGGRAEDGWYGSRQCLRGRR